MHSRRKRIQAIGELTDVGDLSDTAAAAAAAVRDFFGGGDSTTPKGAGAGDLKSSERDYYASPTPIALKPSPGAKPAPAGAGGKRVWVLQNGEWCYTWRDGDTWFDVATRYLGTGKRHPELWAYQDDAFKAKIKSPVGIRTKTLLRMPAEAVQRAKELGELTGGASVAAAPSPLATAPTVARPTGGPTAPTLPSSPASQREQPPPLPAAPSPYEPAHFVEFTREDDTHPAAPWILAGLAVVSVGAVGLVALKNKKNRRKS